MVYKYDEIIKRYGSDYKLKKAIENNEIFKIEKGLYSDIKYTSDLEIITKKFPDAIFSMSSAFYFYNLTTVIPKKYQLAINKKRRKIEFENIELLYISESFFEVGKTMLETHNTKINIYDKERLLIELIRNKNKISYDLYKEVLNNFREIIDDLDLRRIEEYLKLFRYRKSIIEAIRKEVY